MKNIKKFETFKKLNEYFYDQNGKTYTDDEFDNLPDSFFKNNKLKYINDAIEKHITELKNIKIRLISINNDLENFGPVDEEIQDTIDALNVVLKKWEDRPINKTVKKYNL